MALALCGVIPAAGQAAEPVEVAAPILIGLNADMSASLAMGGEALRRGAVIAIDEINQAGGVLGRPLDLVVRDHRGNHDRDADNIDALAEVRDLVAVMGGIQEPVAGAALEAIHRHSLPYLEPWATGPHGVENRHAPKLIFGVSARDDYVGSFLVTAAEERGYHRLALLVWQSAWARSHRTAIKAAMLRRGSDPVLVAAFDRHAADLAEQLRAIRLAGADAVMLIAPPEGAAKIVQDMAALPLSERLPIIAHWGFTAHDFHQDIQEDLDAVDLTFLQTFSFLDPPFPDRAEQVLIGYCTHFDACDGPVSIVAPGATAHAYDLVHLLARAIDGAGTTERDGVRLALETMKHHDGLVRRYEPPFALGDEALGLENLRLAAYDKNGVVVPLDLP